jgi:pimeloyl-ACP methyl ester carboxylesterase
MEHRQVKAGDIELHVAMAGEGDPVVLVHGWPQHWWIWRGVIPKLIEAGYRVIAVDLRGHGWSDAPKTGYEKEQFATDVLAALDTLGVERFKLMGHDWGGFTTFLMALREPERVEKLVAIAIVHPWMQREGGVGAQLKGLANSFYQVILATPLIGKSVVRYLPFIDTILKVGSMDRIDEETREKYWRRFKEPARARATSQVYRSFLTKELTPILKGRYADTRLTVPTLLLYGEKDRVITEERLKGWEGHADDMRVEQVADATHFIPDEKPDLVAEKAIEHFAR